MTLKDQSIREQFIIGKILRRHKVFHEDVIVLKLMRFFDNVVLNNLSKQDWMRCRNWMAKRRRVEDDMICAEKDCEDQADCDKCFCCWTHCACLMLK